MHTQFPTLRLDDKSVSQGGSNDRTRYANIGDDAVSWCTQDMEGIC